MKEGEPLTVQWKSMKQDTGSGRKTVFRFEEPYSLLGTLLAADVQSDGRFLLEALESVRSGQFQVREITGNVCSLLMGRERVVVLDALAADGVGKACVVEFGEFERILEAWLASAGHHERRPD